MNYFITITFSPLYKYTMLGKQVVFEGEKQVILYQS